MAAMNNATAVGSGGTGGAALILIFSNLGPQFDWNYSVEFWSAVVMVMFALPAFGIAVVRYFWRLKKVATYGEET